MGLLRARERGLLAALVAALLPSACATATPEGTPARATSSSDIDAAVRPEPAQDPATQWGFAEIPALPYTLQASTDPSDHVGSSASEPLAVVAPGARLFYRYVAAANDEARQRLCMAFNGGPGASSMGLLLSIGAGLAGLCQLLVVDARNAGLSYELALEPEQHHASIVQYNAYIDAADMLGTLASLTKRGVIEAVSNVVLIGESYAGVRATLMLDFVHQRSSYAAAERSFAARPLFDELANLEAVWGYPLREVFSHQVLIQPTLTGRLQDQFTGQQMLESNSPLRRLATELGATLPACEPTQCDAFSWMFQSLQRLGRSAYDYRRSSDWLDRQFAVTRSFVDGPLLELLSLYPPYGLTAAERQSAFRVGATSEAQPDTLGWLDAFGPLPSVDRYFIAFNDEAYDHFTSLAARGYAADAYHPSYAAIFVTNAARVHSFVTRAEFDLVNYWGGLQSALREQPNVSMLQLNDGAPEPRPGVWQLTLTDGSSAEVRAPLYQASHAVARDQREQLLADLLDWFANTSDTARVP